MLFLRIKQLNQQKKRAGNALKMMIQHVVMSVKRNLIVKLLILDFVRMLKKRDALMMDTTYVSMINKFKKLIS